MKRIRLVIFAAACLFGAILMQLVIAYVPGTGKGILRPITPIARQSFYSFNNRQEYKLTQEPEIVVYSRILPLQLAERVSLEINEKPFTGTMSVDEWGGFGPVIPLQPYENVLVARAPWGSRTETHIFYLPGRGQEPSPPPIPRRLSLTLSPVRATVVYGASYSGESANSPDLMNLLSGRMDADLFVKRVFYPSEDSFTGREFSSLSMPPDFAVISDTTVISITATLADYRYTPQNIRQILNLTPQTSPTLSIPTSATLTLDHLVLTAPPSPWPVLWQGNRLQWVDPDAPIHVEYRVGTSTQAGFAPLQELWREIRRFTDRISTELNHLFLPLVPSIPFLWLLIPTSLRRAGKQADRERRNLLLWLALGMWLLPILAFVVPIASGVHQGLKALGFSLPPFPGYAPDLILLASSLSYSILAPLAYRFSLPAESGASQSRFRWLALVLAAVLISASLLFFEGYILDQWLVLMLMAALVLRLWLWLILQLARPAQFLQGKLSNSWATRLGIVTLLALLAYPFSAALPTSSPTAGWQPQHWTQFYLILGSLLLPYTVLATLIPILRSRQSEQQAPDRASRHLGQLLFAVYVVGFLGAGLGTPQWLAFNLIPFVLAGVWVFPALLKPGAEADSALATGARKELDKRPAGIDEMQQKQWEARQNAGKKDEKPAKPSEKPKGTLQMLQARIKTLINPLLARLGLGSPKKAEPPKEPESKSGELPQDYDARRAILAFGPSKDPWVNVKLSCRYGAILTTLLFLAYSPLIVERADSLLNTPFPLLQMLGVLVLPFFAKWLLAAFLLGCFFPWIRGANGLQKGLALGIAIVACTLPSNVLFLSASTDTPLALLWDAVQTILFLTFLGLWAFDLNTIKRYGLGWKEMLREHGLSFMVSYLSTIGGAIGTAATAVITGQSEAVVRSALELILRGAPPLLGGG